MKNLAISSKKLLVTIPKHFVFAFALLSFIGFLDAAYLAVNHYLGTQPPCSIVKGCEQVANSKYSTVFSVPVALGGVFYYLSALFLSIFYFDTKSKKALSFFLPVTTIGFLSSVWFVYLQLFVIKAICIYCMFSAGVATALFVLSIFLLRYKNNT